MSLRVVLWVGAFSFVWVAGCTQASEPESDHSPPSPYDSSVGANPPVGEKLPRPSDNTGVVNRSGASFDFDADALPPRSDAGTAPFRPDSGVCESCIPLDASTSTAIDASTAVNMDAASDSPANCQGGKHGTHQSRVRFEFDAISGSNDCISETQNRYCRHGIWSPWTGYAAFEFCERLAEGTCDDAPAGSTQQRTRYPHDEITNRECQEELQTRKCVDASWTPWSGNATFEECTTCVDTDYDGYGPGCLLGPDCDDQNRKIHPAAAEIEWNFVDENCDDEIGRHLAFERRITSRSIGPVLLDRSHVYTRLGNRIRATDDLGTPVLEGGPANTFLLAVKSGISIRSEHDNSTGDHWLSIYTQDSPTEEPRFRSRISGQGIVALSDSGQRLYLASGRYDSYVVDISDPDSPIIRGSLPFSCEYLDLLDPGPALYAVCDNTLFAIDTSDLDDLTVTDYFQRSAVQAPISTAGNSLYVHTGGVNLNALFQIDVRQPLAFGSSAYRELPDAPGITQWRSNRHGVYFLRGDGFHETPELCLLNTAGSLSCVPSPPALGEYPYTFLVDEEHLVLGSRTVLVAYDVSAGLPISLPRRWSTLPHDLNGMVALAGDFAFVSGADGLTTVSLAGADVGETVSGVPMSAATIGSTLSTLDGFAYTIGFRGLTAIDIHSPYAPQVTGLVHTEGTGLRDIHAYQREAGRFVTATTNYGDTGSVVIADVTTPAIGQGHLATTVSRQPSIKRITTTDSALYGLIGFPLNGNRCKIVNIDTGELVGTEVSCGSDIHGFSDTLMWTGPGTTFSEQLQSIETIENVGTGRITDCGNGLVFSGRLDVFEENSRSIASRVAPPPINDVVEGWTFDSMSCDGKRLITFTNGGINVYRVEGKSASAELTLDNSR